MVRKRSTKTMRQSAIYTAFILIELLVVIAIIAILINIVIPSLKRGKFFAQKVICSNKLRQQSLGILLYANENDYTVMESPFGGWLWDQSFLTTDQMAEAAGFDSKTFFCLQGLTLNMMMRADGNIDGCVKKV